MESLIPVCMVHQSQDVLGRFQRQWFHGISLATSCTTESTKDEALTKEHDSNLKLAEWQDIKILVPTKNLVVSKSDKEISIMLRDQVRFLDKEGQQEHQRVN